MDIVLCPFTFSQKYPFWDPPSSQSKVVLEIMSVVCAVLYSWNEWTSFDQTWYEGVFIFKYERGFRREEKITMVSKSSLPILK